MKEQKSTWQQSHIKKLKEKSFSEQNLEASLLPTYQKKINCFKIIWDYLYQLPITLQNDRTSQLKEQQKEKELIATSAVLLNQDEDFMQMIETGLASAHAKRIEIYNVIKSVSKSGSMSLSKVEQCLPKELNFLQHGGIRKITASRFSISLQPSTYALYHQGEKNNSTTHNTVGFYLPNTIWTIVSPK